MSAITVETNMGTMQECKLKRDARAAYCPTCEELFGWSPYWHFSKSKYMHEHGTGHKVVYVNFSESGQ